MDKKFSPTLFAIAFSIFTHETIAQQPLADSVYASYKDAICKKLEPLPADACEGLIKAALDSKVNGSYDKDKLKEEITKKISGDPVYGNSALSAVFGERVPLNLEFKSIETKDGDPVLGLSYNIKRNIKESNISSSGDWQKTVDIDFSANGTVTQNKLENPRNFLDTKLTAYIGYTTKIPAQSVEFGHQLTNYAVDAARYCDNEGPKTDECKNVDKAGTALLESTTTFLNYFQRYNLGLDAGYETDQSFNVKQEKISAFVFAQIESWGANTFLSALNINPAIRLSIDSITPNEETPRAKIGDDSSFYRLSGEASFWMPLDNFKKIPVALTFNYRYFKELSPSAVVKTNNLDSNHLATWSLTGTNGLFASYSKGQLPFDIKSENVVELGWKTYF